MDHFPFPRLAAALLLIAAFGMTYCESRNTALYNAHLSSSNVSKGL